DLWWSATHIVQCGIGRRPTTCRTSSRRFLPKLGPCFIARPIFLRLLRPLWLRRNKVLRRSGKPDDYCLLTQSSALPAAVARQGDSGRGGCAVAKLALHEHAVHPPAMLEPRRREQPDPAEAHPLMQPDRAEIAAVANDRDQLPVAQGSAALDEFAEQRPTDAAALRGRRYIDR